MDAVELEEVKQQLEQEHRKVFSFSVDKYNFLFRPLTLGEIAVLNKLNPVEAEDYFVSQATLFPENFDFNRIKAGYVTRYSDAILTASKFNGLDKLNDSLEASRAKFENDIIHLMKTYILVAMPAHKPEDLDHLTMDEFIDMVVLAENIITTQQNLSGMETEGFKLIITPVGAEPVSPVTKRASGAPNRYYEFNEEDWEDILEPDLSPQQARQTKNTLGSRRKKVKEEAMRASGQSPEMEDEHERMKRKYIAQMKAQNREAFSPKVGHVDIRKGIDLEDMDVDELAAMAGKPRDDDPIAAKLFGG